MFSLHQFVYHLANVLLLLSCGAVLATLALRREFANAVADKEECRPSSSQFSRPGTRLAALVFVGFCLGHPCCLLMRRVAEVWLFAVSLVLSSLTQLLLWAMLDKSLANHWLIGVAAIVAGDQ